MSSPTILKQEVAQPEPPTCPFRASAYPGESLVEAPALVVDLSLKVRFMFYDPIRGWRRAGCRESRTRTDWALELQQLLEVDYRDAELVTLVCDNLNTHDLASLNFAFDAETARRLARRVRLVHTPKKWPLAQHG